MRLSAIPLIDVGDVNNWKTCQVFELNEADTVDLYFQLTDLNTDRRFMPAAGALLSATVDHIDDARKITRSCTQPFALDASIWKLSVLAVDAIKGTNNLKLTLTEGTKVTKCLIPNLIRVRKTSCI